MAHVSGARAERSRALVLAAVVAAALVVAPPIASAKEKKLYKDGKSHLCEDVDREQNCITCDGTVIPIGDGILSDTADRCAPQTPSPVARKSAAPKPPPSPNMGNAKRDRTPERDGAGSGNRTSPHER